MTSGEWLVKGTRLGESRGRSKQSPYDNEALPLSGALAEAVVTLTEEGEEAEVAVDLELLADFGVNVTLEGRAANGYLLE